MAQLRLLRTDPASEWLDVLARCSPHDFYHLPEYHALAEKQGEGTAYLFVWDEERWTIALPLLVRSLADVPGVHDAADGLCDATSVYGYAGPIASGDNVPERVRDNFQAAVCEVLRQWGVASIFSRLHPLLPRQAFLLEGLGDCKALGATVSIDLVQPSEAQRGHYRRNHKEGINKLRRRGVVCSYDSSCTHLPEFIELYHETMRRVGAAQAYFFPPEYFAGLRAALGADLHLFGCWIEQSFACGGLFVECDGILQFHLGGTRDVFLRLAPMKLLFDDVREWATARGLRVLHLGGGATASPDDSLLHFKRGFSNRRHDFQVWRYAPDAELYEQLCQRRQRWNARNRLRLAVTEFFPAYRCPTTQSDE
jgi:hypothetical protein